MFTYKGYVGRVEIDEDANLLHGNVINTRDVITFQGETVEEAKQAFEDSIDEYLAFCKENDRKPDKPFSGQFMQRISPELHRAATAQASAANMSLNAWVEQLIRHGVDVQGMNVPEGIRAAKKTKKKNTRSQMERANAKASPKTSKAGARTK